jgi:CHAT domain-containing protein/tetratricopeptide (TPR) repeat protein
MKRRVAWLLGLLLAPAAASAAPPAECVAGAPPAQSADAFEQWWLAGRLHEEGAQSCLERLLESQGDTAANRLRQARRHAAAGHFDAGLALAQAQQARTDLSVVDRVDAAMTLADLQIWRGHLDQARPLVQMDLAGADRYLRLRGLLVRARFAILDRDTAHCTAQANAAFDQARAHFPEDPNAAGQALLSLGLCQRNAGDFGAALATLQRALDVERSGPDAAGTTLVAHTLVSQAQTWKISGDYARATRGYDAALAWLRAHPEPFPAQLSALLHGMANLDRASTEPAVRERSLARYVEAIETFGRAYGADSERVMHVWNNYGSALDLAGRWDEAVGAYERALAIAERNDTSGAAALMPVANLAMMRTRQERYAEAEAGFRRSLVPAESQPAGAETSSVFSRLGLAAALWGQGRFSEAYAEAERAERDRQLALALALPSMSEASAIRYQETQWPGLDLALAIASASDDPGLVGRAWTLAMAARGQVSAGIAARLAQARAARTPEIRARYDAWRESGTRLAALRLDASATKAALITAEDAFDRAAQALAAELPGAEVARDAIDPVDMFAALRPLQASLAAFVSTGIRAPHEYQQGMLDTRPREVHAFVATPDRPLRLVRIADEQVVAAAVQGWRNAAGDAATPPASLRRAGERVRRIVFDPLGVAADARLLLVPYGDLHQLNMAALPDGEAYLVDRGLRVHALNHERELLQPAQPAREPLRMLAVSDPHYGAAGASAAARADPCGAGGWRALPGTRKEVDAIERLLPGTARLTDLRGKQAGKAEVTAALEGQDIVHIAAHGLRRDVECTPGGLAQRGAGLAPVAARETANEDGLGVLVLGSTASGTSADAYLGEQDILQLSLDGTAWVVLSACDSGLGDSRAYEGAFGLRRAFRLAGARSVIMSLWRVDDAATADWMGALYAARLRDHASTIDAIAFAQRATLASRRAAGQDTHPYWWAGFVAAGDWR